MELPLIRILKSALPYDLTLKLIFLSIIPIDKQPYQYKISTIQIFNKKTFISVFEDSHLLVCYQTL